MSWDSSFSMNKASWRWSSANIQRIFNQNLPNEFFIRKFICGSAREKPIIFTCLYSPSRETSSYAKAFERALDVCFVIKHVICSILPLHRVSRVDEQDCRNHDERFSRLKEAGNIGALFLNLLSGRKYIWPVIVGLFRFLVRKRFNSFEFVSLNF